MAASIVVLWIANVVVAGYLLRRWVATPPRTGRQPYDRIMTFARTDPDAALNGAAETTAC